MLLKLKKFAIENKKSLYTAAVILALGLIYLVWLHYIPYRIPCIFYTVTGLACPGCGITSLILKLVNFEFLAAIRENYAVSVIIPLYCVIYFIKLCFDPKCFRNDGKLFNIILAVTLVALIIFAIIRNLPGYEFLLPTHMK